MPFRRRTGLPSRSKCSFLYRVPFLGLACFFVVTCFVFLTAHEDINSDGDGFSTTLHNTKQEHRKLNALQEIGAVFPGEVLTEITTHLDDSGPLSLNRDRRQDLSPSWIVINQTESHNALQVKSPVNVEETIYTGIGPHTSVEHQEEISVLPVLGDESMEDLGADAEEQQSGISEMVARDLEHTMDEKLPPAQSARQKIRLERKAKRITELLKHGEVEANKPETEAMERSRNIIIGDSMLRKYSIWRPENDENALVRLIRDQLIMARVYASLAQSQKQDQILRDLKLRIKENQHVLGEANVDFELPWRLGIEGREK